MRSNSRNEHPLAYDRRSEMLFVASRARHSGAKSEPRRFSLCRRPPNNADSHLHHTASDSESAICVRHSSHACQTFPTCSRHCKTAWCAQHLLVPFTVDGACNQLVFETWMETCKRTRAASPPSNLSLYRISTRGIYGTLWPSHLLRHFVLEHYTARTFARTVVI